MTWILLVAGSYRPLFCVYVEIWENEHSTSNGERKGKERKDVHLGAGYVAI